MAGYFYFAESNLGAIGPNDKKPIFAVGGGNKDAKSAYFLFGEVTSEFPWNEDKITNGNYTYSLNVSGITLGGEEKRYTLNVIVNYGSKVGNVVSSSVALIPGKVMTLSYGFVPDLPLSNTGWLIRPGYAFSASLFVPPLRKIWFFLENGPERMLVFRYKLCIARLA